MMAVVRIKGLKRYRSRGKEYFYHRPTGVRINAEYGTAEFYAEFARLDGLLADSEPKPGTLGQAIVGYKEDPRFTDLADRTKVDYRRVLDYVKPISGTPLVQFDRPLVVGIRDKAAKKHGRRFGNYVHQVLSLVFGWASERGFMDDNPAKGIRRIKRDKNAAQANRPWTDVERQMVLDSAPPHILTPIAIAMFTALRESDVLKLTWSAYRAGAIDIETGKTGQRVIIPCVSQLSAVLDGTTRGNAVTICLNSRGRPWTPSGFRASWRTFRQGLEGKGLIEKGLTIHGLRHTVAVILAEAGYDDRSIADFLGHSTGDMARHYSRGANLKTKMAGIGQGFSDALNNRATKVSSILTKVSNKPETVDHPKEKDQ